MPSDAKPKSGTIEASPDKRAPKYPDRSLNFTYDRSLDTDGTFRWAFDAGEVRCSKGPAYADMCYVSPEETNVLSRAKLSFLYLDVGRWGGAGPNSVKEYSFGVVSGPDVYLCEYNPDGSAPAISNPSVNALFADLARQRCGVNVLSYERAQWVTESTAQDEEVHLLLGDYHLAPVSWFYSDVAVTAFDPHYCTDPPSWMVNWPPVQHDWNRFRTWAGMVAAGSQRARHEADIFTDGGQQLCRFLRGLAGASEATRRRLRVIQLGDMYDLWFGRPYQFKPGNPGSPEFADPQTGPNRVAGWMAEAVMWNQDVYLAHSELESSGVAEVSYVWGNHDAYLMRQEVCSQCKVPQRVAGYDALSGDLHAEHGHRFDSHNFDNNDNDGPAWSNVAFFAPWSRTFETFPVMGLDFTPGGKTRDGYIRAATLLYMFQGLRLNRKPFSVFVMGHTHRRALFRHQIRIQYSNSSDYASRPGKAPDPFTP